MAKSVAALRVAGTRTGSSAEATIVSADWKTYFGMRSIFIRTGCTHLCERESAERFTSLRLSWHSIRLSLCFPPMMRTCHTSLWNPVYGMRAIFVERLYLRPHRQHIRQHSWICVAPKLWRCRLIWITDRRWPWRYYKSTCVTGIKLFICDYKCKKVSYKKSTKRD